MSLDRAWKARNERRLALVTKLFDSGSLDEAEMDELDRLQMEAGRDARPTARSEGLLPDDEPDRGVCTGRKRTNAAASDLRERTNGDSDVCRCGCHKTCGAAGTPCCGACPHCGRFVFAAFYDSHVAWCRTRHARTLNDL